MSETQTDSAIPDPQQIVVRARKVLSRLGKVPSILKQMTNEEVDRVAALLGDDDQLVVDAGDMYRDILIDYYQSRKAAVDDPTDATP